MDVSAPSVLAKLARPNRGDGVSWFSNVYAIREHGLKRRRKEVCAAVDGDSLNIYEIQNGAILTSYPVPPTSRFFGPPCSIRQRTDGETTRKTYCGLQRNDLHIESFQTSGDDSVRPISFASSPLLDQESPITLLETVPSDKGLQVLVVQQNGDLSSFSQDLQTVLLQSLLSSHHHSSVRVLAGAVLTAGDAQKTVLKHRPDIVSGATHMTIYLAAAYTKHGQAEAVNSIRYGLWALDTYSSSGTKSIYPLIDHELFLGRSGQTTMVPNDKSCAFHTKASSLFVRTSDSFFTYDLTRLVPAMSSNLHAGLRGNFEIMAISPAFAMCSSETSLRLYDLKYQALQASNEVKPTNLKRKRMRGDYQDQRSTIEFVAYYPQLARVIGRRRQQLVAIDIAASSSSRQLELGNNLLSNIGRGVCRNDNDRAVVDDQLATRLGASSGVLELTEDWKTVRQQLDDSSQAVDVATFEETFVHHLQACSGTSTMGNIAANDMPVEYSPVPLYKTSYLTSKLFEHVPAADPLHAENAKTSTLRLHVPSRKLLRWLCQRGLLSSRSVARAIAANSSEPELANSDSPVSQALVAADPSYGLLVDCLETGFSPYVEEQAAVVQLLIQEAVATTPGTNNHEGPQTNGDAELQIQSIPSTAPENTWLPSPLSRALIVALEKFGSTTAAVISTQIRSRFSQTEALALIQFLRQQLFQGGYTRTLSSLPVPEVPSRTVRLDVAVKILSSCVDAIGPLGFFGGFENEDFIGNIVPELVSEVNHTKESLDEVSELQGILREALRYQQSIQKHRAAGARISRHDRDPLDTRPGAIMTVYSEATEEEGSFQAGVVLPLGLKLEGLVSPLKVRKGGGQVKHRSVRQKRMLERNKGQYSFERLVL